MTEEEIFVRKELEKVYPQLQKNMKKVCGHGYDRWGDDLLAVSVTYFLEKPLNQQLKTIKEGKLENFITFIANMQLKSNSSKHYNLYRKPGNGYRELFEIDYNYETESFNEELMQCIEQELNNLEPDVKKAILDIVYLKTPLYEIAESFNLGTRLTQGMLDEAVLKLQRKCKHCL